MPRYMLLIYNPAEGGPPPEEMAEQHQRWVRYTQDLEDAGLFVASHGLQGAVEWAARMPSSTYGSVEVRPTWG